MDAISKQVDELASSLRAWAPGDAPATTWLLPELREILGAAFAGTYRPRATDSGWQLDFMEGVGEGAAGYVDTFRRYVAALPPTETFLALSNPHFVDLDQRNCALSLVEVARVQGLKAAPRAGRARHSPTLGDIEPFASLFRSLGISGHDQLRVLVCDGPRQLAWVGATREQAFTEIEMGALRRLTKPLAKRLRLEHQLRRPDILAEALEAALEALQTPAFVVGPSGSVELTNHAGLELWKRNRSSLFASIKQSEESDSGTEEFSVTRLGGAGQGYRLAVRQEPCRIASRLPIAVRAWGLTTRQALVLECLAGGASNKEIAIALTCSEVTVENHISELFRRSNTRSRASLVSKLLR